TANGLVLNSFLPTGSKFTPTFMLSVGNASDFWSVSIVERQLCTLTLNRNGPFGDEQVPGTYARSPLIVIDSSRFGKPPETLSKTVVSGSRLSVLPSDRNAAPTSGSGARWTSPITWWLFPLMTVTRPSRPSSAPSRWVGGRGSSSRLSARNCVTN